MPDDLIAFVALAKARRHVLNTASSQSFRPVMDCARCFGLDLDGLHQIDIVIAIMPVEFIGNQFRFGPGAPAGVFEIIVDGEVIDLAAWSLFEPDQFGTFLGNDISPPLQWLRGDPNG